jgi:N-acyl-D-amino-acid deacylase
MSTLIKNGRIIDGTGDEAFEGSILIENEKIGRIIPAGSMQDYNTGNVKNEIDASGLIVAPGFIDAHAHDDLFPLTNPSVYYKLEQGVTTSVSGNCGESLFPLNDSIVKEFTPLAERLPGSDKIIELLRQFTDFEHFRKAMNNKSGLGPNLVFLIGHGIIRMNIMGVENRISTESELEQMRRLVASSMQQGAFGMSTGLIYPPGVFAATNELIELCKVVAEYKGVYATHMRGESDTVIESVKEAIEIGRKSGVRVQISHHKIGGEKNWGKSKDTLKLMEDANAEGIDVKFDVYPYLAGNTGLSQIIPPQYYAGGKEEFVNQLKNKDNWNKIRDEIENPEGKWENFVQMVGYKNLLILNAPESPEIIGKTVFEYAREIGKDPLETAIEVLIANNGDCGMAAIFGSEEDLIRIMQHPLGMVCTDGVLEKDGDNLHPRTIGTYPRVLGHYIREKKILPLTAVIKKMTSIPAKQFRITNKGAIKEQYDADLVLFDPQTIKENNSFTAPYKKNSGIHYVFVNGEAVVENNIYNGTLNGSILKSEVCQG